MASVWTQGPGLPPKKLEGYIDGKFEERLVYWANKLAKRNFASVAKQEPFEIHLRWPDGKLFAVWLEFASPPSAPEEGQPKIAGDRGLVMRGGEAHVLQVPK